MKDLEKRFNEYRDEFPALGDVIVMSIAVEGMKYSRDIIRKCFDKLVSLDSYDPREKNELISFLSSFSQAK